MSEWGMKAKEFNQFQKDLKKFSQKEFAIINGMALNKTAFETMVKYKKIVKKSSL